MYREYPGPSHPDEPAPSWLGKYHKTKLQKALAGYSYERPISPLESPFKKLTSRKE